MRDRVLEATRFIPLSRLGTTDDCGFSPFADDASTSRDTAFAKIQARVAGTALAADELGIQPDGKRAIGPFGAPLESASHSKGGHISLECRWFLPGWMARSKQTLGSHLKTHFASVRRSFCVFDLL